MKLLYVGPDYRGSNGTSWRDAFVALGCEVRTINAEQMCAWPTTFIERASAKAGRQLPSRRADSLNAAVVRAAREFEPEVTFFVQGRYIRRDTLLDVARSGVSVVYYNDDMYNPNNQTPTFADTVRYADCLITTKSFNVSEFNAHGARRVMFLPNAFDSAVHFPSKLTSNDAALWRGDVAFIGTFRPERADFLSAAITGMLEAKVNVWGDGWEKMYRPFYWGRTLSWRHLRRNVRGGPLWCADMGKAVQANKVILGLLYHANRDLHTSRSFEIPACAGFMLAERTIEHQEYFEEDREAAYFDSLEELIDKARYYIRHDTERTRIAAAAYERCQTSGYGYVDRAKTLLQTLRNQLGRD